LKHCSWCGTCHDEGKSLLISGSFLNCGKLECYLHVIGHLYKGSVSWGSAGRSPLTSTGAWGTATPGSSPPVTNNAWGSKQGSSATGSNSTGGAVGAWGGGGSLPHPASAGSGTRPSSVGSIRQGEQQPDTPTANSSSSPPWGPRPTSGLGVQVQTQVLSQASFSRPRSADTLRGGPSLSRFGDSSATALAPAPAWSGHATAGRLVCLLCCSYLFL